MGRKLAAILVMVALAVAFLPAAVDGIGTAQQPTCCSGIMCPMHHSAGQKIICVMDLGHQGTQFQACPSANQHYAALVFVPMAPAVLIIEWLIDSRPIIASPAVVNNTHDVLSPPPQSVLS